jgi:hypothetical protein
LRCWWSLVVLLRRVALLLSVALRLAITLRLAVLLLGWLTVLLLRWLAIMLLRWLTILLLLLRRGTIVSTAVVAVGKTTITGSSTARRSMRVIVRGWCTGVRRVWSRLDRGRNTTWNWEAHQ